MQNLMEAKILSWNFDLYLIFSVVKSFSFCWSVILQTRVNYLKYFPPEFLFQ